MRAQTLMMVLGGSFVAPLFVVTAIFATDSEGGARPPAVAQDSMAAASSQVIHVDTWQLLQSSGAELYQQLCASCHGIVGSDRVVTLKTNPVVAPDLAHLRDSGVPRKHWTYVIESPCEDPHHWATDRTETMPCWRQIFQQALNSETLPMLVSVKLGGYLESVQD